MSEEFIVTCVFLDGKSLGSMDTFHLILILHAGLLLFIMTLLPMATALMVVSPTARFPTDKKLTAISTRARTTWVACSLDGVCAYTCGRRVEHTNNFNIYGVAKAEAGLPPLKIRELELLVDGEDGMMVSLDVYLCITQDEDDLCQDRTQVQRIWGHAFAVCCIFGI